MRRLLVGEQYFNAILEQKESQNALIVRVPAAVREPGSKLTEHDEWQHDRLRGFENFDSLGRTFAEVDVAIGVDRYSHFHRVSSTRS